MMKSPSAPYDRADLARRRVIYAEDGGFGRGRAAGIEIQVLEDYATRFTGLVRLAAGIELPPDPDRPGTEILVLRGQIDLEGVLLGPYGHARHPASPAPIVTAATDTLLFVKRGHIPPEDRVETIIEPTPALWKDRQNGEIQILPLHHQGSIAISLMRFQPGAALVARRRAGGEEILVLDGTLLDERSAYPRGTWIRNPPGSLHEPFSVEGCTIYLQVGHLPIV